MRIGLLAVEFFSARKFGGFGKATRTIGSELVTRGHDVVAIVPARAGDAPAESVDGIRVRRFPPHRPDTAYGLVRDAALDVVHSQEPSTLTWIARHAAPDAVHVVTARDPRTARDWWTEFTLPSVSRLQVVSNMLWEDNPLVWRAVRGADFIACASPHLVDVVQRKYRLGDPPLFLPTPVHIPPPPVKSRTATVCFVSRFDRRKRPRLFLDLAATFPDVRFIAVGGSRDAEWDARIRQEYTGTPNLTFTGFIDQFASDRLSRILEKSWVLVNTAASEGLPNAFLEAAAHGCAIVSGVDPAGFTSRFGEVAHDDAFSEALERVLRDHAWREKGERARQYVMRHFGTSVAVHRHLEVYRQAQVRWEGKRQAGAVAR